MQILGIDIGFGFTKATNGGKNVIFKSLLGEATEIKFRTKIGLSPFEHNLHVTVDDKSYFVGEFAEQQSDVRQFTLDQETLISEFVKILALTVTGMFADNDEPVNVVSGLPVGYLKQYYRRFTRTFKGIKNITYHNPDGTTLSRRININKVRMMPQPLGSVFNLLMNESGKIVNKELTKQKIGVIDIGFRTTDFTILDQLQFVDRGSVTVDTGISRCFSVIARKLREQSGVNIELYRLYKAVGKGVIKIRGRDYDISNLRDQVYAHAAGTIASDINRLWAEDWDIDTIVLTGGGCMELAKFLQPLIDGNVIPVDNEVDTRLNNVLGYLKYGKYNWGDQGVENPASDPPPADTIELETPVDNNPDESESK